MSTFLQPLKTFFPALMQQIYLPLDLSSWACTKQLRKQINANSQNLNLLYNDN